MFVLRLAAFESKSIDSNGAQDAEHFNAAVQFSPCLACSVCCLANAARHKSIAGA